MVSHLFEQVMFEQNVMKMCLNYVLIKWLDIYIQTVSVTTYYIQYIILARSSIVVRLCPFEERKKLTFQYPFFNFFFRHARKPLPTNDALMQQVCFQTCSQHFLGPTGVQSDQLYKAAHSMPTREGMTIIRGSIHRDWGNITTLGDWYLKGMRKLADVGGN